MYAHLQGCSEMYDIPLSLLFDMTNPVPYYMRVCCMFVCSELLHVAKAIISGTVNHNICMHNLQGYCEMYDVHSLRYSIRRTRYHIYESLLRVWM